MQFRSSLASIVLAASMGNATAAPKQCVPPTPQALRETWQAFRAATLEGEREQVARFYKFPLKLLSPQDGDPAIRITRPVFLANYNLLFRRGPWDDEVGLFTAMKKTRGDEYIPKLFFHEDRCVANARIEDYEFVYDRSGTWRIDSVYLNEDYSVAKDARLDKPQ